jgi:hypothetical protein
MRDNEQQRREIKVFCPIHNTISSVLAESSIICETGLHTLAQGFPYEDFWQYCCDCNTFSPIVQASEAEEECYTCARKIKRRYLCKECKVITIESDESSIIKSYRLTLKGGPVPSCPGCLANVNATLVEHDCYALFASYITAQTICPFCHESIMSTKKNTGLATRKGARNIKEAVEKRPRNTKEEVESAKHIEQIRALERKGRIAAWNDYISFGVSKFLGFAGLVVGGLEALDPAVLPITLKNPELVAGIGLALLTGKSILTLIAKVEKSIGGR